MANKQDLIWIDLEMTGLNPDTDVIIEIATVVTDANLELLAEGPSIAIHQPNSLLESMDEWNTKHHGESGLTKRVLESKITMEQACEQTLAFLRLHLEPNTSPMCGNSIGQDRRFLVKYMPKLESFFHYRNLDVSSIKEVAKRWNPEVLQGFTKKNAHLALDDIYESIAELKHYREHFFKLPESE